MTKTTYAITLATLAALGLGCDPSQLGSERDAGMRRTIDAASDDPSDGFVPPEPDAFVPTDAGTATDAFVPPPVDLGPPTPEVVLSDPLAGSSLGTVEGGTFESEGGWRAGVRITWDLGREISRGRARVRVRDFDPGVLSTAAKHHIFSLYTGEEGNHHREDAVGHAWMNVRTGTNYGSGFKFLSTPEGFTFRQEDRLIRDATWDRARTYELRVEWDETSVAFFLDETELVRHEHGRPSPVRFLFLGADHTYPAMPGPIYSDVEVIDLAPR